MVADFGLQGLQASHKFGLRFAPAIGLRTGLIIVVPERESIRAGGLLPVFDPSLRTSVSQCNWAPKQSLGTSQRTRSLCQTNTFTLPNEHVHFAKRTRSLCQTNTFTLPNEHVHFTKRTRSLYQTNTFTLPNGHVHFAKRTRSLYQTDTFTLQRGMVLRGERWLGLAVKSGASRCEPDCAARR